MEENEEIEPLLPRVSSKVTPGDTETREEYVYYTKRWFMVAVLALLNFSNGMIWITFSAIADITAEYYDVGANGVNWLALVFVVVSIPLGFFAIWALDTRGLKKVIHTAAWLNLLGAGIRLCTVFETVPLNFKYPLLMCGQCVAAYAQPFVLFAPTKMAALWFPEKQRAIANTIASMANPVGILAANILSPSLVKSTDMLFWILEATALPAAIATFFTYMIVTSDTPRTPPSASAGQMSETFLQGIKMIAKNKNYWVLCYSFGSGMALFSTVFTLLEQILCSRGYSDEFSGVCVTLMIVIGFAGAAVAGIVVDKTKRFEEVAKVSYCLAIICLLGFAVFSIHPHIEAAVAIGISLLGLFGLAIYPVCLELSVECTYPVAEATSAGLLIISGQLQSALYIVLLQVLARPYTGYNSVCHSQGRAGVIPQDYTVSNLVFGSFGVVASLSFLLFFKCDYKRLNAEKIQLSERLVPQTDNVHIQEQGDVSQRSMLEYT